MLIILSLPIHEHAMSFYLPIFFKFIQKCFVVFTVCLSPLWLISKCFILFDTIYYKGNCFCYIFFSNCSLLMYRNANNFCVLILYLATLLNSTIYFKFLIWIKYLYQHYLLVYLLKIGSASLNLIINWKGI